MSIDFYDPEKMDGLPERLTIYGASDYAVMEARKGRTEPDFTEHLVAGLDSHHHLWMIDNWSGQFQTDKSVAAFLKLVKFHKPQIWWTEGGLIDKAIGPYIRSEMAQQRAWVDLQTISSMTDKASKLQTFHAMCQAGAVHFPIRRKWADEVIEQLIKFPAGRWDDKADACGLLARGIDQMQNPHVPMPVKKEILTPMTEAWLFHGQNPKPKVRYF
jgi:predicted phage terminase large subunit-like protein